ncbi:MAG: hypothetical protein LBP53_08475 [Candidatus Peribacteria bacterium]|nr:hypothetical protein [Candidatus Peribacteria bacterium]
MVGEGEVKAKIEQLTQRTYEVPRFDTIVDLTNKLKFPKPELNGFDYEIDAQANLQFNFGTIYGFLDNLTTAINNLSTAVSYNISDGMNSISKVAQDGADIVENCINNPEQCKTEVSMFNGLTTDEINYVDYPQAKSRLENVLAYFNTQASQDETTLRELKAIQSTLTTPRTIEANQQGVEEMQQQISKLITDEQSKIQLTQATLSSDYDQLIRALEKETSLTQAKEEKNLAFNLNFFNVDQGTEKLLTTMENPYKILLDNKAPIIDNFLNEINTTSPELLNMTLPEYQRNKQTLSTLKNQLAGFYQRLQPTYQTSLQTKQGSSTTKTLTAQSKGTTAASSSQSMSIDPAAYVNGIFVKTNSSTATKSSLTKVVYSERNAESIGTNYYTTPLNTDNADDIILWDDHNVYIKYGNQNDNFNGPHNTTKTYFMKAISTLPSEKRIINFDDNTKLKVSDYHEEVRNFAVRGQSFDAISLGRRPNREASVAGYLIKLTDRIDYSPEKEDTNKKLIETYILVLPKGTDTTGMKLTTFPTQKRLVTNELLINDEVQNRATPALKEATKNKLIAEIRYYDPNQSAISVILENIERKRQYARITTLRNENNTLQISAPRSNQVVAGKQILGDDE